MQIHAVKDSSGKTVATFEAASAAGAEVSPKLPQGFKVEPMEVAPEYHLTPEGLYK